MSSVVISGDTSGAVTLTVPAVSGTNTATLPAATGTVMVSGNMPAFSAYNSGTQSISSDTNTKVTFSSENFDTNSNFSSNRFTPTVAGYYAISSSVYWGSGTGSSQSINLYKNGSNYIEMARTTNTPTSGTICGSAIVYCNGSTDYLEIYWYSASGTCTLGYGAGQAINFSGSMVRGA